MIAATQTPVRTFSDSPAVRTAVPLFVGLVGPTASGKTYSALRVASGIQRVSGGDIYVIDTESRRALHYADKFNFRHVPFGAPFSPLDYLQAIQYCVDKGAKVIVVDSASHEHEGPGGVLEWHDKETERLTGGDPSKYDRFQFKAWGPPKQARRRLINSLLQFNCNFVFCFRAKEKLKVIPKKAPEPQGYMAIAGEEFVFEMTATALLLPGSKGTPTWQSEFPGERETMKLPVQFHHLFRGQPRQLDEDTGQAMAQWAAGGVFSLIEAYRACAEDNHLQTLERERKELWPSITGDEKLLLKSAADEAVKRLAAGPATAAEQPLPDMVDADQIVQEV